MRAKIFCSSAVISEQLGPVVVSCTKQTPVGFWRSALLKCGKLKDFQDVKLWPHPFLITCLLHPQSCSSPPNVTAACLVIFGDLLSLLAKGE